MPEPRAASRPKVLAADDVAANLALVQATIQRLDCELVTAQDGMEALAALERDSFAVVLLDVQMPGMDGYEAARRIRTGTHNRDVPIIFLTASASDDASVVRGYDLGAVDFLFKPVDPTILSSKVRVFLDLFSSHERIVRANVEFERAYVELRTAQAQLVHSAKMASLGTLVAGVAHEINNPLAFCISHVNTAHSDVTLLSDEAVPEADLVRVRERARQRLAQTQEGLSRIRDLVLKLRTFSRVDEGELQHVDVKDCVESVLTMLEHRFSDRLTVTTAFAPPKTLECRAGPLNQAVMNLLSNAIDATPLNGLVHVECGADSANQNYVIRVEDSGTGIPPNLLERVLEPFFTTKAVGEGTGLGLAITDSIAVAHGGSLRLENGAKGAIATLTIPLHPRRS